MKQVKKKSSATRSPDAISILTEDHKKVKKLFTEFKKLKEADGDDNEKAGLVNAICTALTIHTQIEEEIFYPAVRAALDEDDLMDEADEEHESAKALIGQLEAMEPGDDHYDAKVTVLGEYIDHHVKEEQDEMFPKVKKSKLDLVELGSEMLQRQQELQAENNGFDSASEGRRSHAA